MNIKEMETTRKMKWREPTDAEALMLKTVIIGDRFNSKTKEQQWDEHSLHEMERMLTTAQSLVGYAMTKKKSPYYGNDTPAHYRIAKNKGIAYEDCRWDNPYRGIASTYKDNQFTITCKYDGWKANINTVTVLKEYIEDRKEKGEDDVKKAQLSRLEMLMGHSVDEWIKRRRLTEEKVNIHHITKMIHREVTNRSLGESSSTHGPWSFDLGEYTRYLKRTQKDGTRPYSTDEVTHLEPAVMFAGAGYRAHLLEQCWLACISHLNYEDGREAKESRDELGDFILEQLPKFQPHHSLLVRASVLWCQAWKGLIRFMDAYSWGDEE